jgi:hypothetical protein
MINVMNQIDVMKQVVMLLRDGPDNHVQEAVDLLCQAIEQAEKVEPVLVVARHDLEKLLKRPEGDKHIKAFIPPGMGDEVLLYTHPPTAPAEPPECKINESFICTTDGWITQPAIPMSHKQNAYKLIRELAGHLDVELAEQNQLTDADIEACMKKAYATAQGRQLEHAFARAIEAHIKGSSL